MNLAGCRKRVDRALHGALARAQCLRQGRARPRRTVAEQGKHRCMLTLDGRRQHENLACAARLERKPTPGRAHAGQRSERRAKSTDLDS
jgi:hypothetical protein